MDSALYYMWLYIGSSLARLLALSAGNGQAVSKYEGLTGMYSTWHYYYYYNCIGVHVPILN